MDWISYKSAGIYSMWKVVSNRKRDFLHQSKLSFISDFSTQWSFIHCSTTVASLNKFVAVPHPKLTKIAFLFRLDSTRRDVHGDSYFREALFFFLVDWKGREKISGIKFMSSSHPSACDDSNDQRWWNNNLIGFATSSKESPNRLAQTSANVLSNSFLF